MEYRHQEVIKAAKQLKEKFEKLQDKRTILRAPELAALYDQIKELPAGEKRAKFGKEVNSLKQELEERIKKSLAPRLSPLAPIDVTAPFDVNVPSQDRPDLLPAEHGSKHPLMAELELVLDIFGRMGFSAVESREIDDDYHMFGSLNFPADHPARDDYDTFMTDEGLIAPAHTSTMQNRVLKQYKKDLEAGKGIRFVIPGRVFRNEDLDARHEHTFYQLEGVYADEGIHAGHLVATIKAWLSNYFGKEVKIKIQPFYFPFTEPSFEFAASCPFCEDAGVSHLDALQGSKEEQTSRIKHTVSEATDAADAAVRQKPASAAGSAGGQGEALRGGRGCNVCSYTGWIELGGCGMIHPNVFKEAAIDSQKYTGFAWGFGIERLVMLKYNIEDIRHFESANLKFLRQFK